MMRIRGEMGAVYTKPTHKEVGIPCTTPLLMSLPIACYTFSTAFKKWRGKSNLAKKKVGHSCKD